MMRIGASAVWVPWLQMGTIPSQGTEMERSGPMQPGSCSPGIQGRHWPASGGAILRSMGQVRSQALATRLAQAADQPVMQQVGLIRQISLTQGWQVGSRAAPLVSQGECSQVSSS